MLASAGASEPTVTRQDRYSDPQPPICAFYVR